MSAGAAAIDDDALLAAFTLAPGVYSRNRYFSLFEGTRAKELRSRAAVLRGVVRLLYDHRDDAEIVLDEGAESLQLRLRVPKLAYQRSLSLTTLERSLLLMLVERAAQLVGQPCAFAAKLAPCAEDRARVDAALARLV